MGSGSDDGRTLSGGGVSPGGAVYRFEGYEVDCHQWQVRYLGRVLTVHRKSFDLLVYLLQHRGRVVGKDELLQAVWPDQFVEENNLSQQISLLRKALSQHDASVKIIETTPGRGYRLVPAVEVLSSSSTPALPGAPEEQVVLTARESVTRITVREESEESETHAAPDPARLTLASRSSDQRRFSVRTALSFSLGFLLLGCVLAGAGWFGWRRWQNHSSGPPLQVVLVPLHGSTGDALLDRALAETLRGDLLQSPFVSIVPSTLVASAMQHMQRKESVPADLPTAREVCERTNSQAVIESTLARDGGHFLLTGEATGCVDGSTVSMTSQEASRAEDLPGAIGRMTNTLRRKLGESRSSIARFNTHIADGDFGNTASLEALEAESQAAWLNHQGRFAEAVLMEKRALDFDPRFMAALYDLAVSYADINDMTHAREVLTRAYGMRNTASPLLQMMVTARYEAVVTGDLFAAERNARTWTQMFPRAPTAWNSLTNIETELGKTQEAEEASQHALMLRPDIGALYYDLAEDQRALGKLAEARATCERALAAGQDGEPLHMTEISLALAAGDKQLYEAQLAWLEAHPRSAGLMLITAQVAVSEGRFAEAQRRAARAREIYIEGGETNAADAATKTIAREMIAAGDSGDGVRLFQSVPLDPEDGNDLLALAMAGEAPRAEQLLAMKSARFPEDTLVNRWWGPMIHARADLAAGRPTEAAAELEPTRVLDDRTLSAADLRGQARLAAGQPQAAEAEYRRAIAGASNDAISYTIPLAWLGLGRALAAQGNRTGAVQAYRRFLTKWAHADPDAAPLQEARHEFAALGQP